MNFAWEITPLWQVALLDILDMAIVAFVLYRVAIWIKSTKVASLFKGLLLILVIYGVSQFLGLRTIAWLVESLFNIGLIAMVIVFQPELRKMLEEIGRGSFAPHMQLSDEDKAQMDSSHELITAVLSMAKTKTGALIVIEQQTSLQDIEQTGTAIDARLSKELILNLFHHNAPLHDGAMLIRRQRVAAASCILPLTASEIGKELGTRHRAAVGISENADALVLVVSEETGKISLAHQGKLQRNLDRGKLEKLLMGGGTKRRKLVLWKEGKQHGRT